MEELSKRPLVLAALGFAIGVAAHDNLALLLGLAALLVALHDSRSRIVLAACFALGALLRTAPAAPLLDRKWIESDAQVISVPRLYADRRTAEIDAHGIRLLMTVPRGTPVTLGDTWHVRGVAKPFREGTDLVRLRKGLVGRITPLEVRKVASGALAFQLGERWRGSFVSFCERALPDRVASIVAAVCFNVDTALDPDDRLALSRSGTTHIISASGLHVAMFATVLAFLLSLVPIPRSAQLAVLVVVLSIYAIGTGLRPPVIRSVLMASLLISAYLFRREGDGLSAIALAALVQLGIEPVAIYDIGFQLSFVIITALYLFRPVVESAQNMTERIGMGARQGLTAMLASMPLLAYHFGTVSITALPANLLIAISIPALMIGALFAHVASFVSMPLADTAMQWVVKPMVGWLFTVTDLLGGEWAAPSVPYFSGYWVAVAYIVGLLFWRVRLRPA